ncbi:MAG: rod-binding protein [Roseburia sp.]|nr:rod-binding protein [Roseburia sp.]
MDISGLTSSYDDIYSKAASQSADKLEGQLKNDYSKATDDELMDVCKQFESYFLEQVFKEMQKTVTMDESTSDSTMIDYFKDQAVQKIAADSTEQNGLGLAQMLYEQMRRNYGMDNDTVKVTL